MSIPFATLSVPTAFSVKKRIRSARLTPRSLLVGPSFLLVALVILVPVGVVLLESLRVDGAWSLGNFRQFFTRPHYVSTLYTTLEIALACTAISMALAIPACAFVCARSKRVMVVFLGCVMLSMSLSGLIRTLSWQILLSRSGPLNALLVDLGLMTAPANMLFTRGAVIAGMVQMMLPYAIALVFAGMRRIDVEFIFAARSLGASPFSAFRLAYLPQIRRSLCSAALLVFVLSSGFIITPALLGGTGDMMIGNVMLSDLNVGSPDATAMAATSGVVLSIVLVIVAAISLMAGGRPFNVRRTS